MNEVTIEVPAVLIRISKLFHKRMSPTELYEATRGVWKVGLRRDEAEYAFSVAGGIVREVYKIQAWLTAGTLDYETRPRRDIEVPGRWEFKGMPAEDNLRAIYVGFSVKHYLPPGAANPITYVNC